MDRRRILLVTAALVAAVGTLLVFLYVRGADTRAEQRFDAVEVLRATAPIEAGETIEAALASGKVELQPVSQEQLLEGYLTSIDQIAGQVAVSQDLRRRADHRRQVRRSGRGHLSPADPQGSARDLGQPHRPGPGGRLREPRLRRSLCSSTAATSAAASPTPASCSSASRCSASVRPLSVSTTTTDTAGQQTTEQLPRTLLTIAVSQAEAQRVLFASSNGELAFGLLDTDQLGGPRSRCDCPKPVRVSAHACRC